MGGRRYSNSNDVRSSKEKAAEQGATPGRYQRRNSNKGGKMKEQKANSGRKSEVCPSSPESGSSTTGSYQESTDQELNVRASHKYNQLFTIFKKDVDIHPDATNRSSALLRLIEICSHEDVDTQIKKSLPYCCFKDLSYCRENLTQPSNKSQIIGLGIRLKEIISHM